MKYPARSALFAAIMIGLVTPLAPASADNATPYAGTKTIPTKQSFKGLWNQLESAVQSNRMGIVGRASASSGAKSQGFDIPGNAAVMVFRNDFARRMLAASIPAGFEAPLRFYITENADGTATLTYRTPSSVFSLYGNSDLNALAGELDLIFEKIVSDTIGR